MKRREFVLRASGAAGILLLDRAHAQTPCPPALTLDGSMPSLPSCPAPTDPPAWVSTAIVSGWAVGQWLAISGSAPTSGYGLTPTNTMEGVASGVPTGFASAFIHAWNGAAICHGHRNYGVYMMGPGGAHNEYARGDMFMFDLETRRWEQAAPPNTSGYVATSAFGEYNDGAPVTNHTAFWPFYDSHRNEFALPKGWGDATSGSDQFPKPYGHGFNLSAYESNGYSPSRWRRYPQLTGISSIQLVSGLAQQCGGAWDEARKSYWLLASSNSLSASGLVARYDSVANTWTAYAQQWSIFLHCGFAIDPVRDVLVMPASIWNNIRCMDLSSPNTRYDDPTSTDALWTARETGTAKPTSYDGAGWEWSTARNGFLFHRWDSSPTQVKLASYVSGGSFQSGTQTNYTLSWSNLLAANNAVSVPPIVSGETFSKFRLARWGSTEIAFFYPRTNGAMYAFRVS